MYRSGTPLRTEDRVNFVLSHGAIGDMISSLPAICWARKMQSADLKMAVWVAEYQVELVRHLIGGPHLEVLPLSQWNAMCKAGQGEYAGANVVNYAIKNTITRNRFDMVDYSFACLLDRQPDGDTERNYPYWAPLGEKKIDGDYAVIPVGATNPLSTFHAKIMAPVLEWLLAQGIKPVLTGKRGRTNVVMLQQGKAMPLVIHDKVGDLDPALLARCEDLRDRTDLLALRDLCGHAKVVLGIDGGTLHLAGTTEAPIVYGCTRVDPRHRSITRHDERNWNAIHVVPRDLECAGCQSNWTLMFGHDFATCAYEDAKCTEQLHPDDFIQAADILLRENSAL